ncbi:hypothetical protein J6590_068829 [Homalodisca vitripennis]|nr:hypothetical protein J6590_068829 [Homalodisca vitripennis]
MSCNTRPVYKQCEGPPSAEPQNHCRRFAILRRPHLKYDLIPRLSQVLRLKKIVADSPLWAFSL